MINAKKIKRYQNSHDPKNPPVLGELWEINILDHRFQETYNSYHLFIVDFLYKRYKTNAMNNATKTFSVGPTCGTCLMTVVVVGAETPATVKVYTFSLPLLLGTNLTMNSPFLEIVKSYLSADIFTVDNLLNTCASGSRRKISTLSDPLIAVHLKVTVLPVTICVTSAKFMSAPPALACVDHVVYTHSPVN